MPEYNKVILLGNLTRDPDLRYTPQGLAVCEFPLAVTHKHRAHEEAKEEVCYIDVVVFGRSAETMKEHLHRGSRVLVDGRLAQRRWETAEGQKRNKHEVVATTVQFIDGGSPPPGHEDDLPI
ncbi:MAG TPA: single-stranded DNA-binding protein [Verrucomicrobiae bacterium]|jgi:single-strand DNA-binding protein|nr:single-stranded DNA-binding protein [Verrucomicrobiae bacterium]